MEVSAYDQMMTGQPETVDPTVRAFIYSLVNALGGSSADNDGAYVLGDDALACLRDIRRWLSRYDEQFNRLDVARCLAEANLVEGDLLEILAQWPEHAAEDLLKQKTALACFELLVPLTWPIEMDDLQTTRNHHRHAPYLELAQVKYKRAIIHFDRVPLLTAAVRVALPSIAEPKRERSPRDEGIIRIILYFLRNIASIDLSERAVYDGDASEISRSVVIDAFHDQSVFPLLLTLSSNMGTEFFDQDVVVLEVLFHLLKGTDPSRLFMSQKQVVKSNTKELTGLLQKEKAMSKGYRHTAPTRHNRFGTTLWVKRGDENRSTVSGQDVLASEQLTLRKMDQTKKWKKPKGGSRAAETSANHGFDRTVPLSTSARDHLRAFVEDFLDSSFNPLFTQLRKTISGEAHRVLEAHRRQYSYLIAWFLRAEQARRTCRKDNKEKRQGHEREPQSAPDATEESFSLVASVLNQETFVLLNRLMQRALDEKQWQDLNAAMKCFTQILLTVQDMSLSLLEEDQEIAENIQNRIFYEQTTHDRIAAIVRSYKSQSPGFLDACTELCHVFLRMLERYARQNVDLQIRSRRRKRKRKQAQQATTEGQDATYDADEGTHDIDDIAAAERVLNERKFDFNRFAAKFVNQASVDTFVLLMQNYNELSSEQLKRAHRFFYRIAFKMDCCVLLMRMDILSLFHRMIKGPQPMDPERDHAGHTEWEELIRQIFRRVIKKFEAQPALAVEVLFSKIPGTLFYLENGYERETTKSAPRPPAELEMKSGLEWEKQVGVAVAVLIDQGKADDLAWVRTELASSISERQAQEDAQQTDADIAVLKEHMTAVQNEEGEEQDTAPKEAEPVAELPSIPVKPDTDARKTALFKDNKLRLLLFVLGVVRHGEATDTEATWSIPGAVTAEKLREALALIQKFEYEPMVFENDKGAASFIRSKAAAAAAEAARAKKAANANAADDEGDDELDMLFPAGGPTTRPTDKDDTKKPKRKRTRHTTGGEEDPISDGEAERRAAARRERESEKRRKIKSSLFVRESDDESDDERDAEFFEKEEQLRRRAHEEMGRSLMESKPALKERKAKRRKMDESDASSPVAVEGDDEEESEEGESEETPPSSQVESTTGAMSGAKRSSGTRLETGFKGTTAEVEMEDDDDDGAVLQPTQRRVRAGFIIDDDDSE